MVGNTTFNERMRYQLEASLPLRKQLWQQTVKCKIENQAYLIGTRTTKSNAYLHVCAGNVKSGDSDNQEALAAAYYWKNIFPSLPNFVRGQDGLPPNNLLNYGYSILRVMLIALPMTSWSHTGHSSTNWYWTLWSRVKRLTNLQQRWSVICFHCLLQMWE